MNDKSRKGSADFREEIDIRLDGLLGELGRAFSEMLDRLDDGIGEVTREQDLETGRGPMRAQAGIRIRMGGSESLHERKFDTGEVPAAAKSAASGQPSKPRDHDLTATILEEDNLWALTADLPGITRDDLTLKVEDGELLLQATGRGRRYIGRFRFPATLTEDDLTISLRNGILDVTAKLPKGVTP